MPSGPTYNQIVDKNQKKPSPTHVADSTITEEDGGGGGGGNDMHLTAEMSTEDVEAYFFKQASVVTDGDSLSRGVAVVDRENSRGMSECALMGLQHEIDNGKCAPSSKNDSSLFLNTHEPFCLVTVGVQGGGKSHTLGTVLESCLIPFQNVVRLNSPMAVMVFHYDHSATSICEATGLINSDSLKFPSLPKENLVVLVSPSYYLQRKQFYGSYCTVKPLLFQWSSLSADHIKKFMGVKENDSQLYMSAMLDLLRRYQREAKTPAYLDFIEEVKSLCKVPGQEGPLRQRLQLLESIIAESSVNSEINQSDCLLKEVCGAGKLVVVDLTDPLLSKDEANSIFQVLTEQFRTLETNCGKLLALDEAHKFMDGSRSSGDGLSDAIVSLARLMRHDGIRLAISTQSPKALAPELLELLTVAVLHRFHSRDWLTYLQTKLPLNGQKAWDVLIGLKPGQALVFASQHAVEQHASSPSGIGGSKRAEQHDDDQLIRTVSFDEKDSMERDDLDINERNGVGRNVFAVQVRPRLTADRGRSRLNM
jgi:hypothetical protein